MKNNYLLITEGAKTEPSIFSEFLPKYGFNVEWKDEILDVNGIGQFDKCIFNNGEINIVVVQGTKNRLKDFIKEFDKKSMDIERFFGECHTIFDFIFLIYDVDHNTDDQINEAFSKFNDESSGLLLLNCPCVEVLGDKNENRVFEDYHLKSYKKTLNIEHSDEDKCSNEDYIKKNFNSIMIKYLKKNYMEFNESNIMEHPALIIEKNSRANLREENGYVLFRYFTTVIYVFIACINGLTKEIQNYDAVLNYFLQFERYD